MGTVRKESISVKLNNIHEKITENLKSKRLKKEADEIEQILFKIKKVSRELEDTLKSETVDEADKEIAKFLYNYIQKDSNISYLFGNKNTIPQDIKKVTGEIFEYEMGLIFQALQEKMGGKRYDLDFYLTGMNSSSVNLDKVTKNLQKNTIDAIQKAAEKHKQILGKTSTINPVGFPVKRDIKTDIKGISNVNLNINISADTSILEQLAKLTQGKTFSLKNYGSKGKNFSDVKIGLGKTNLYKALMGSLNTLYEPKESDQIIYQGMQILAKQQKKPDPEDVYYNVARHFAHLRFMYDLSGAGLLQQDGKMTDFIIYNDPSSDRIAVQDTYSVILQALEKNNRTLLFSGENEIAASHLFANPVKRK